MDLGERLLANVTGNTKQFDNKENIRIGITYPGTGLGATISKIIISVEGVKYRKTLDCCII